MASAAGEHETKPAGEPGAECQERQSRRALAGKGPEQAAVRADPGAHRGTAAPKNFRSTPRRSTRRTATPDACAPLRSLCRCGWPVRTASRVTSTIRCPSDPTPAGRGPPALPSPIRAREHSNSATRPHQPTAPARVIPSANTPPPGAISAADRRPHAAKKSESLAVKESGLQHEPHGAQPPPRRLDRGRVSL